MNPPTKSELLFQEYCEQRLYSVEKIQTEENKRTADFVISTPLGNVFAEVKEACPNDKEREIIQRSKQCLDIPTQEKNIGKRIRGLIDGALGQTKNLSSLETPCVVVLYDNIIDNGVRPFYPNFHFNYADIAFGMYGELKVTMIFDKTAEKIVETRNELGRDKKLRTDQGQEISAVCLLLSDDAEVYPPNLYTFGRRRFYTYAAPPALKPFGGGGNFG
ncbi:MAG: hypothetical protein ABSF51_13875 [Verrucomicrobiota bacterium]|jgi:hypothetical protein